MGKIKTALGWFIGRGAFEEAVDGPLTAPVWFHYLFKILTSVGIAFGLLCLTPFGLVVSSVLASFGFFFILKAQQAVFGDGDPAKYTFIEHLGDDVTDGALAAVTFALALFEVSIFAGVIALAVDYVLFRAFNRYARPGGFGR